MKLNLTIEEAAALHGIASAAAEMERFRSFRFQLRKAQDRLGGAIQRAGGCKIEEGWRPPKDRIRHQPMNVELKQEEAILLVRVANVLVSSGREHRMRKVLAEATRKLVFALERAGVEAPV